MEVYSFFSICLSFIILLLITVSWRNMQLRKSALPPLYPGSLPIIGHTLITLSFGKSVWEIMKTIMLYTLNNSKDACTIYLGKYSTYFLTHPEDCNIIANTCLEKHQLYKFGDLFFGEGLVTAPGLKWKRQRKLLSPALNQQILDEYLGVFNRESKILADALKEKAGKKPFVSGPFVQKFAIRSVSQTTMDFNDDNKDNSELFHEYVLILDVFVKCIMERLRKIWLYSDRLFEWSNLKTKQDKIVSRLNQLADKIISKKEIEMQNKLNDVPDNRKTKFKSYLELLLELKIKNVFSNKEVKEQANTLIAAGFDTVSVTLTQILIVLGSYPDIQEKLYTELVEIFDGKDQDVTKQHLTQMKYMVAVIKETLRLYPSIPIIARHIDKDVRIREYTLPAGHDVAICIWALNRHSVWGPDAQVFRPERWLDPSSLPDEPGSFGSFSTGRRNCIGINYAMMILKTGLAHILRQYKINADVTKVKYNMQVTMHPVSGHHITLEKR